MLRALLCLVGGSLCGLGIAATFGYVLLMFGPDLPNLIDF